MRELVVLSGKGGTGKTSLVAAFAALTGRKVLADCDVDAADLHLLMAPAVVRREDFWGARQARILPDRCAACGACAAACRFEALFMDGPANDVIQKTYRVDPLACEGCGVCAQVCPAQAVALGPVISGEWYVSETRHGPMVHARLAPAGENSGKLVSLVRTQAARLGSEQGLPLVIVDGAPGIGCPVIASVTGATMVLAVTEPSLSAQHDLERVAGLAAHFGIPLAVCINRADLNVEVCSAIERWCRDHAIPVVGTIPYDPRFTEAQIKGMSLVEFCDGPSVQAIREVWRRTEAALDGRG
jgi:MinD superfamily P-loop ATPase